MSLNFDIAKIDPSVKIRTDEDGTERLSVVTETMIFATMAAGFGSITEKNYLDFYARIHVFEMLRGGMRFDGDGQPLQFTLKDVHNHIGLTTNVSDETDTAWRKRILQNAITDYKREARNASFETED